MKSQRCEASRELQSYDPIDSHKALNHMTWAIVKTTWTLEPPSKWALYAKHAMNAPCQIAPYSLNKVAVKLPNVATITNSIMHFFNFYFFIPKNSKYTFPSQSLAKAAKHAPQHFYLHGKSTEGSGT